MASSSVASFSSSYLQFPVQNHSPKLPAAPKRISKRRTFSAQPFITATLSEVDTVAADPSKSSKLPIKEIPGDYGLPFFGPWKDRQDFFYNQGREEFFKSRVEKYQSTVFRSNMPPGPFISSASNVIILLDGKSFPILFDTSVVEKKDLFTGTYMPSTELTGGYRILSYLDPSEPNHTKLKNLLFFLLTYRREAVIPEFSKAYTELFEGLEKDLAKKGKASFGDGNDQTAFNFLAKAFYGVDPKDTKLGTDAPGIIAKWVLLNLHPILTLGLPRILEDPLLHTFSLPPFLVKSDYQRMYDFIYQNAGPILDQAEKDGLSREEACHNLLFATCFNAYGGFKILFPSIVSLVGQAGVKLHAELAQEIRSALKSSGGKLTMAAMESMPLMKSVVYEVLRIQPPVPFQYAKAKRDLVIESHDAAFQVKAGEMMFGYQPFATKDPKIFVRPEEFVPDRFVGEEGEKLLNHVLWSNGPETESPTVGNKQCAGKNFVVMGARLLVVELFRRYDSFDVEIGTSTLGSSVDFTSLKPASS